MTLPDRRLPAFVQGHFDRCKGAYTQAFMRTPFVWFRWLHDLRTKTLLAELTTWELLAEALTDSESDSEDVAKFMASISYFTERANAPERTPTQRRGIRAALMVMNPAVDHFLQRANEGTALTTTQD